MGFEGRAVFFLGVFFLWGLYNTFIVLMSLPFCGLTSFCLLLKSLSFYLFTQTRFSVFYSSGRFMIPYISAHYLLSYILITYEIHRFSENVSSTQFFLQRQSRRSTLRCFCAHMSPTVIFIFSKYVLQTFSTLHVTSTSYTDKKF